MRIKEEKKRGCRKGSGGGKPDLRIKKGREEIVSVIVGVF